MEKKIKRGVSLFSYSGEYNVTMDFQDCMEDMKDMGATGVEILADGFIEGYPIPTKSWLNEWENMLARYNIEPAEYGHWVESRLYAEGDLSVELSLEMLEHDIKLASSLGFKVLRTKLGVSDETLTPVSNWKEIIRAALPIAEKYDVVMCPEIHYPTFLLDPMITEYIDFIKEENTKHFGLNIDFGIFQTSGHTIEIPGMEGARFSKPEELRAILPYVYCCHAKFLYMDENFEETTIPYPEIVNVLVEEGWEGYLISEYEGENKDVPGYVSTQLKRHQIMLKRLLGY